MSKKIQIIVASFGGNVHNVYVRNTEAGALAYLSSLAHEKFKTAIDFYEWQRIASKGDKLMLNWFTELVRH